MSDGTFRPSGATPWSSYNTPRIWAMVEPEDDPEAWRQVSALGSLAGLLKDQRSRLEAAKQKLIDAWPPDRNKAARAFVDEMDELLFTMQVNKDIADSNAGSLGQILEALRQAKEKIAPLYQAYLDKSDDWVPGWWDHAEDELDEQARAHMREAEQLVAHPGNAITAPTLYEFQPDETRTRAGDGSGADGAPEGSGSGVPSTIGTASSIAVPHEPPPPVPRQDPVSPAPPGVQDSPGPSLAEVITPPPASVPVGPAPNAAAPSTGASAGQVLPGVVIGGGGRSGGPPSRGVGGSKAGVMPFGGGGQRGLPSGAVIGNGVPGRIPAGSGKPTPPSWLPQAQGQSPRGGAGTGQRPATSAFAPMAGGRPSTSGHDDREVTFDPDNPWFTAEGVTPVIEPSRRKHRHDPGPGVIGWQR